MSKNKFALLFTFMAVLLIIGIAYADGPLSIVITNVSYSSNIFCGSTQTASAKVGISCRNCINGVSGSFRINNSTWPLSVSGHPTSQWWGPFSSTWTVNGPQSTNPQSFIIKAVFNTGCHCYGGSQTLTKTFNCTDPNEPPVVTAVSIEHKDVRVESPSTSPSTIRNRFGGDEEYEKVWCSGEGYDPDGSVSAYNFSLKIMVPSGTRYVLTRGVDYNVNNVWSSGGVHYEEYYLKKKVPVGSFVFCNLELVDNKGAKANADSM